MTKLLDSAILRGELESGLQLLSEICHQEAQRWWHDPTTGQPISRNRGEMLALIHSEISECLEGERKPGTMDSHLPHRPSPEVELADAIIRIADYAQGHGYDLAGAVLEKLDFNRRRQDHSNQARAEAGGKKF